MYNQRSCICNTGLHNSFIRELYKKWFRIYSRDLPPHLLWPNVPSANKHCFTYYQPFIESPILRVSSESLTRHQEKVVKQPKSWAVYHSIIPASSFYLHHFHDIYLKHTMHKHDSLVAGTPELWKISPMHALLQQHVTYRPVQNELQTWNMHRQMNTFFWACMKIFWSCDIYVHSVILCALLSFFRSLSWHVLMCDRQWLPV